MVAFSSFPYLEAAGVVREVRCVCEIQGRVFQQARETRTIDCHMGPNETSVFIRERGKDVVKKA